MLKPMLYSTLGASALLVASIALVVDAPSPTVGYTLTTASISFDPRLEREPGVRDGLDAMGLDQGPQGIESSFIYQGVILDESGDPAIGPLSLVFGFFGTDIDTNDIIYFGGEAYTDIMPDEFGRFVALVPFGSVDLLETTSDHYLEIKDTTTNEVISTTPVYEVPMSAHAQLATHSNTSSTSEHAELADHATTASHATTADQATQAENATNAGFATNAQHATTSTTALSANTLTEDGEVVLMLDFPFEPYAAGWDDPKANRIGRMVHLSGLVRPIDTGVTGQLITTLPTSMRPQGRILATAYTSGYQAGVGPLARIDIHPDGSVVYSAPAPLAGNWFSLTGISFPVAP